MPSLAAFANLSKPPLFNLSFVKFSGSPFQLGLAYSGNSDLLTGYKGYTTCPYLEECLAAAFLALFKLPGINKLGINNPAVKAASP